MTDCIFCKIVNGDLSATIVHKGAHVTAFRDIHPAAPVHVLVVPNRHIADVRALQADDAEALTEMFLVANQVAAAEGLAQSGYRLLFNYGPDANLVVPHLHLHLLGGRPLGPMVTPARKP